MIEGIEHLNEVPGQKGIYDGTETYLLLQEQVYDKEAFKRDFSEALSVAKARGLQLYCGEYGCINSSPVPDRVRWWRDINEVFEEMGIARAVWDYKGDFGILKREWPDRPMLDALMGKPVQDNSINF